MLKKKNGFSLIEVIVSMVLFTIVFVSLIQLFDVTTSLQKKSKRREHVTYLTTSIYETYLLNPLPSVFESNLNFVFDNKVENISSVYYICFTSNWETTSNETYSYKVEVSLTLATTPKNPTPIEANYLFEDSCQVVFYDGNNVELYTKNSISAYVFR